MRFMEVKVEMMIWSSICVD